MSEDPNRQILAAMTRIEAELTRLRQQFEVMRADIDTMRARAVNSLQDNLVLSRRVTKLEEEMRRRPLPE